MKKSVLISLGFLFHLFAIIACNNQTTNSSGSINSVELINDSIIISFKERQNDLIKLFEKSNKEVKIRKNLHDSSSIDSIIQLSSGKNKIRFLKSKNKIILCDVYLVKENSTINFFPNSEIVVNDSIRSISIFNTEKTEHLKISINQLEFQSTYID